MTISVYVFMLMCKACVRVCVCVCVCELKKKLHTNMAAICTHKIIWNFTGKLHSPETTTHAHALSLL